MNIVDQLLRVSLLGATWVLYLLIALSVASLAAIFERWVYFRKNAKSSAGLREDLDRAFESDDVAVIAEVLRKHESVEAQALRAALAFRKGGPAAFTEALEAQIERARVQLDRGMNFLGTLGNNAPFIGLFGTIIGVIEAFQHLGVTTADGSGMEKVMAGIAEALIATAVGIFVAIPAVVAFNAGQKKIAEIEGNIVAFGRLISAWLRSGPADTAPEAAAKAADAAAPVTSSSSSLALEGAH